MIIIMGFRLIKNLAEMSLAAQNGTTAEHMEIEGLEDSHLNSDETLTKSAVELQKKLDLLKQKIVSKKAELTAKNQSLMGGKSLCIV